jgi:hypothetical protein
MKVFIVAIQTEKSKAIYSIPAISLPAALNSIESQVGLVLDYHLLSVL